MLLSNKLLQIHPHIDPKTLEKIYQHVTSEIKYIMFSFITLYSVHDGIATFTRVTDLNRSNTAEFYRFGVK